MRGCHPDAQGAQSPGRTLTRPEGESLPQVGGSRTQGVFLRWSLSLLLRLPAWAWSAGFLCNSCSSAGHYHSRPKDASRQVSRKRAPCRAPGHGSQAAAVPSTHPWDALGFPPFFSPSLAALGAQGHPEPEGPVPWDLSAGQQSAASSQAASHLLLLRWSPRLVCSFGSPSSLSLLSCLISPL